jgi:seryl-tRNA synthetase
MLEIQRLRTEKDAVLQGLQKRNIDATATVDAILAKDTEWRAKKTELEIISAELNRIAKQVGELFQQGKQVEANEAKAQTVGLKEQESVLKAAVQASEEEMQLLMYQLPNVPNELVPAGKSELDNVTVEEVGS